MKPEKILTTEKVISSDSSLKDSKLKDNSSGEKGTEKAHTPNDKSKNKEGTDNTESQSEACIAVKSVNSMHMIDVRDDSEPKRMNSDREGIPLQYQESNKPFLGKGQIQLRPPWYQLKHSQN